MSAVRSGVAAIGVALVVVLAGCASGPDVATPTPAPSATPSDAQTSSPVPPAVEQDSDACETVLDPNEYDVLAESGLVISDEAAPLGPVELDLVADGALACTWVAPGSDVALWVARLEETEAAWQARLAELIDAGWTQTDEPVPGTYVAPAGYTEVADPVVVRSGDVTWFVSTAESVTSLAEID